MAGEELQVGETLGGCRIIRKIGKGGMGVVFEAHQISLDRKVAVKVLQLKEDTAGNAVKDRIIREARLAAKLNHPNVVQVFDVCQQGAFYFLVMEYVEGVTLKDLLIKEPLFPVDRLVRIARKTTRGLAAAHAKQIVHRDIKPENLLVTSSGEVKITDFGAASLLVSDEEPGKFLIGTPPYMAPEVILRRPVDGRADVYALGLILYAACVGGHPFRVKAVKEMLKAHVSCEILPLAPRRPEVPEKFADLIERMCAKKPHLRCTSEELLEILEAHPEWEKVRQARVAPSGSNRGSVQEPHPLDLKGKGSLLDVPLKKELGGGHGAPEPPETPETPKPPRRQEEPVSRKKIQPRAKPLFELVRSKEGSEAEGTNKAEADTLCRQARFHLMKKNWTKSEQCFLDALRQDPQSETALLGLARLYAGMGRHEEAVARIEKAVKRRSVDPRKILESPHFQPLRELQGFRRLMAELHL